MKRKTFNQIKNNWILKKPIMKRETFKSTLLIALVASSVILTWNLWTYKFDPANGESNQDEYIEVAIDPAGKLTSISEAVYPSKVIFHQDGQYYGTLNRSTVDNVFKTLRAAKFERFSTENIADYEESEFVEVIFPANISPDLYYKLLTFTNSEENIMVRDEPVFDRVTFYKTSGQQKDLIAVFKNHQRENVAVANVNGISFSDLMNYQTDTETLFSLETLGSGNKVFLRQESVKVPSGKYSYEWVQKEKFKKALFLNQEGVFRVGSGDSFSDTVRFLKFEGEGSHFISFIDPGTTQEQATDMSNKGIVAQSFDFVNGNSGWTDQYMFSGYSGFENKEDMNNGVVTFRLTTGYGDVVYPVFSPVSGFYPYGDAATIRLSWQNGNLHEFARTRMDLLNWTLDEPVEVEILSGPAFLDKLTNVKGVKNDLIEDVKIGYSMKFPELPNESGGNVNLNPAWFVLYNGEWQTIEDLQPPDPDPNMNKGVNKS